jgi:putative ABC transport system ATP-binding protein
MELIRAEKVSRVFGEGATRFVALDAVDFHVQGGEIVMLMGPSGSGKTTLLSILGCILSPSSGRVHLAGEDVTAMPASALPKVRLRRLGFIFQSFNLFPALNVRENVEVTLNLQGVHGVAARKRAEQLLERVGLTDKLRSKPADLSGGQKQRVAIARALAGDPPIILADEPTAALDSASGQTVMEILKELAQEKQRAVVVVTHDSRVLHYASRIVSIADGRIQEKELVH